METDSPQPNIPYAQYDSSDYFETKGPLPLTQKVLFHKQEYVLLLNLAPGYKYF